jgi:hypothetical protein
MSSLVFRSINVHVPPLLERRADLRRCALLLSLTRGEIGAGTSVVIEPLAGFPEDVRVRRGRSMDVCFVLLTLRLRMPLLKGRCFLASSSSPGQPSGVLIGVWDRPWLMTISQRKENYVQSRLSPCRDPCPLVLHNLLLCATSGSTLRQGEMGSKNRH